MTSTNNSFEKVTEIIECESILTRLQSNASFSFKKKGYVRLIKHHLKRSYIMQLFMFNKDKPPDKHKPILEINICQKDMVNPPQFKHEFKMTTFNFHDGVVQIELNNDQIARVFHDKLIKCLADVEFIDDSFLIVDKTKNIAQAPKLSHFQIDNEKEQFEPIKKTIYPEKAVEPKINLNNDLIKQDDELLKLYSKTEKLQTEQPAKTVPEIKVNENETSVIPNKMFYNGKQTKSTILKNLNEPEKNTKPPTINMSLGVIHDLENFRSLRSPSRNLILQQHQQQQQHKRRRENSVDDYFKNENHNQYKSLLNENKPNSLTPKRTCTSNVSSSNVPSNMTKNKNTSNQENQENHFDFDDQENYLKSPIKTWNRNNSKTFGKGFSNLGNTCYMNAILQCLLNIDIFLYDLVKNYELIKLIQHKKQEQQKQSNKTGGLLIAKFSTQNDNQSNDLDSSNSTTQNISNQNSSSSSSNNKSLFINKTNQKQDFLYNCLCELVKARESHNETLKVQSLKEIKNTISQEATRFSGYQQHDAHEFLCQVLDQLKDDIDRFNKMNSNLKVLQDQLKESNEMDETIKNTNNDDLDILLENLNSTTTTTTTTTGGTTCLNESSSTSNKQELEEKIKSNKTTSNVVNSSIDETSTKEQTINENQTQNQIQNPVVDNFQFEVTHAIECKKCNSTITKYEEYNNLCLELPDLNININNNNNNNNNYTRKTKNEQTRSQITSMSIQDALDIFFKDELLSDFKCEKCKSSEEVLIKRKFNKLPRILILHLKRYQFKEVEETSRQVNDDLSLDDIEDITNLDSTNQTRLLNFKLVKNDSSINIPRYLTLKYLLTEESNLKPPVPIDKNFFQKKIDLEEKVIKSGLNQNFSSAKTPLGIKQTNINQQSVNKNLSIRPLNLSTNRSPLTSSKSINKQEENSTFNQNRNLSSPQLNSKAPKRVITNNYSRQIAMKQTTSNVIDLIDNDSSELPDLNLVTNNIYDRNDFSLESMNEQEQINLALKLSLENDLSSTSSTCLNSMSFSNAKVPDSSLISVQPKTPTSTSKQKPILTNSVKKNAHFLDGTFDNENNSQQDTDADQKEGDNQNLFKPKSLKKYTKQQSYSKSNSFKKLDFDTIANYYDEEDAETRKAKEQSLITYKAENQTNIDEFLEEDSIDTIYDPFDDQSKEMKSNQTKLERLIKRSQSEQNLIDQNAINGTEPNSYRLIGIVNHLGSSSNSGHYISDVYNSKSNTWSSYDDTKVEILTEEQVVQKRVKTGYIFFYIHNSILNNT